MSELIDMTPTTTARAVVVVPIERSPQRDVDARTPEAQLGEAVSLAKAIDLTIVDAQLVNLSQIRPSTYVGQGKVDELAELVEAEEVELFVFDCALAPTQQRNLERALKAKVLDRTGLILEIFGERALTKEGRLQVDLAHLTFQKSRLVRSWTHLERQRGGVGFLGGPGETQIEADRRALLEKITRIERDLAKVQRTRQLQRAGRRKANAPTIALVGYTNAGKSTLFNALTESRVLAADQLFATLDPNLRAMKLPTGTTIILSDTVGFVSDLPTQLVAAFRATLEEVVEADLIVHVRDIASEEAEAQAQDVLSVLRELGVSENLPIIEAWNKVDRIDDERRSVLREIAARREPSPTLLSAATGEGLTDLLNAIADRLAKDFTRATVHLPAADGKTYAWLHRTCEVLDATMDDDVFVLDIRAPEERLNQLNRMMGEGGYFEVQAPST